MTTMKDVALRVGVDTSTVSRALSGDTRRAPKRETRDRILAVALEMGYRPNSVGRMLRTRRTETIGLVVPDISNPGFAQIFAGVRDATIQAGYHVVVADGRDEATGGAGWDGLAVEGRVDGLLVLAATIRDPTVLRVARSGFPLVLVNRRSDGVAASVVMDDAKGAAVAVEHLAGIGHQRIAHIAGPSNVDTGRRRLAGFRSAMSSHGLPIDERWIAESDYSLVSGGQAAEQLLRCTGISMPTGVYISSMLSAFGALTAFEAAGLQVPDDISVVVSDELEMEAYWRPPLTTVAMPLSHMGAEAARMLLAAIDGTPGTDRVIPDEPRLVVRSSTRPWPPR